MAAFQPEYEAQRLQKAMKGLGTDEATIIDVLGHRMSAERVAIAEHYKAQFGKDLKAALKSEISGNFLKTCKGLIMYLADYDATQLHKAVKGAGTNEQTLIDILVPRNNLQITSIKEAYTKLFKKNLEQDIISDTSGNFKLCLTAILQAKREEIPNPPIHQIEQDADELYFAGERRLGTDEEVFNRILCFKSFQHIAMISEAYKMRHKKPLIQAVSSETSGSYYKLLEAIVNFSCDPAGYYASLFYESMKGAGTKDIRLQRLCINQKEGNIQAIKQAFQAKYKKPLSTFIREDTSGDYRKLLLTIIGDR